MSKKTSLRFNPLMLGGSIILLFIFASCNPRALREQDQTASVQPPPSGAELSTMCLDCHEYGENHHPVNIIVPSKSVGSSFPLYNGKIMCLTCHHEDHMNRTPNLLREGPYAERREFCFKCHDKEQYAKIDPHIMLDGDGNVLDVNGRLVCLFCHTVKPDAAKDQSEDVRLRADDAFLCWRCHPRMADSKIFNMHFLRRPTLAMQRFMEGRGQQLQVAIPLAPRERITCSTCHNPHQKGVILYGPSAKGAGAPDRLRLPSLELCYACHNL